MAECRSHDELDFIEVVTGEIFEVRLTPLFSLYHRLCVCVSVCLYYTDIDYLHIIQIQGIAGICCES